MAYSKKQLALHSRVIMQFLAGADIAAYNAKSEKWEHTDAPDFAEDVKYVALNAPITNASGVYEMAGLVVMSDADIAKIREPSPISVFLKSIFENATLVTDDLPDDDTSQDAKEAVDTQDDAPVNVEAPAEEEVEVVDDSDTADADVAPEVAPAPLADEAPAKFVRGDIWESREGRTYLILGDKAKIDPNYTGTKCKEAQIVVLRLLDDDTTELSHRNADGTRTFLKSGKPNTKRDLVKKIDSRAMRAVGSANQLLRRTGAADIYYDPSLEESRLR